MNTSPPTSPLLVSSRGYARDLGLAHPLTSYSRRPIPRAGIPSPSTELGAQSCALRMTVPLIFSPPLP